MSQTTLADIVQRFSDNADNAQFNLIFNGLQSSNLTQKLDVPQGINKEIAHYATGFVHECHNNQCQREIFVLNQDILRYRRHIAIKLRFIDVSSIGLTKFPYFCYVCMNKLAPYLYHVCWIANCKSIDTTK